MPEDAPIIFCTGRHAIPAGVRAPCLCFAVAKSILLVSCAGLLEGLRQAVPLVEPLCETSRSRRSSHAASCMQQPNNMPSAHLPSRSPSEDELGRLRHAAWQELPPELVALILCRASVRERKLCEPPDMALVARTDLHPCSGLRSST